MSNFNVTRISQDMFDETVKENIEEFEMSLQDAIAETVTQFTSQSVDLSELDITGGIGRQELLDVISILKETALNSNTHSNDDINIILNTIEKLRDLCISSPFSVRNRALVRTTGGLNALYSHISKNKSSEILIKSFNLLELLSENDSKLILPIIIYKLCYCLAIISFILIFLLQRMVIEYSLLTIICLTIIFVLKNCLN